MSSVSLSSAKIPYHEFKVLHVDVVSILLGENVEYSVKVKLTRTEILSLPHGKTY